MDSLMWTAARAAPITFQSVLLALLLTYCLTQTLAAIYVWTFRGMSYTQGLVHAIVLGGIVACMLMVAIGDSIAAGLGVAGGLALVRFRTALREPRDMMFVFAALGAGIASGLGAYPVAIVGTLVFSAVVVALTYTEFGSQHRVDGLLRFQIPTAKNDAEVATTIRRHTSFVALVTLREVGQGRAMEHAYQIRLPHPGARTALVQALEKIEGVESISLLLTEPTVEL